MGNEKNWLHMLLATWIAPLSNNRREQVRTGYVWLHALAGDMDTTWYNLLISWLFLTAPLVEQQQQQVHFKHHSLLKIIELGKHLDICQACHYETLSNKRWEQDTYISWWCRKIERKCGEQVSYISYSKLTTSIMLLSSTVKQWLEGGRLHALAGDM